MPAKKNMRMGGPGSCGTKQLPWRKAGKPLLDNFLLDTHEQHTDTLGFQFSVPDVATSFANK